jgi:protein phosphatase
MLICPQCQFENPNNNKFCQKCGTSLSHKTCPECRTQVPINAETCHDCGTYTGTVWWAIITKEPSTVAASSQILPTQTSRAEVPELEVVDDIPEALSPQAETTTTIENTTLSESSEVSDETKQKEEQTELKADFPEEGVTQPLFSPIRSGFLDERSENFLDPVASSTHPAVYLDFEGRYRLLEPESLESLAADQTTPYGASARVLDSQPFQKSLLEVLMEQQKAELPDLDVAIDSQEESETVERNSTIWQVLGIPASAKAYLSLHQAYYPTMPEVHDAWQQDGVAVVLLEDRSGWQILGDLWGSEALSTLQILYWLDEMAKLWEALEPWKCRQSLLEITNLRVDEDQALGLVRLYPEVKESLTLQDLGEMWQMFFNQSGRTQFASLGAVYRQLADREIKTVPELRSLLEAIAREHQPTEMSNQPAALPPEFDQEFPVTNIETRESSSTVIQKPSQNEANFGNESDDLPTVILPMQLMSLDDAGCTDIGQQREHNEDCFGIHTQIKKQESPMGRAVQARGLYVLCDGMGGHAAGEVASSMAVERLKLFFQENWQDEQLPSEEIVREAVRVANQAIYDVNQQNARSGSGRMGTTLVMILIQNTEAVVAHVGDSRLYRLTRKMGLEQVTVDHEVGQREIQRGVEPEIAYSRPDAYQLTQALGPRNEQFIKPDVQFMELNEDSLFVLCSDGLSDNDLIETHWQTHLAPLLSSRANLDQGILQLIELANEHNGHDNITAVLIRVKVRPNFEQQLL